MSRLPNIANTGRVSAARYEHAVEEVSRIRATCRLRDGRELDRNRLEGLRTRLRTQRV